MTDNNEFNNKVLNKEQKILDKADQVIKNYKDQNSSLYKEYKFLFKEYKKLYKQIQHILKISDSYQKDLIEARNQLQQEIKEKNKTEEKLKEKIQELEKTKAKLEKTNEKLSQISSRDQLTGLYNRREFEKRIKREWRAAIREDHSISLIMMDIDHFKQFNDTYGHLAGDNCLQKVSQNMEQTLKRPRDFLARYGGEEFIAILPKTEKEGAQHVAELVKENIYNLEIPHKSSPVADYVTISLGVTSTSEAELFVFEEILDQVDQALYQAKEKGRNQYHFVQL